MNIEVRRLAFRRYYAFVVAGEFYQFTTGTRRQVTDDVVKFLEVKVGAKDVDF